MVVGRPREAYDRAGGQLTWVRAIGVDDPERPVAQVGDLLAARMQPTAREERQDRECERKDQQGAQAHGAPEAWDGGSWHVGAREVPRGGEHVHRLHCKAGTAATQAATGVSDSLCHVSEARDAELPQFWQCPTLAGRTYPKSAALRP